MSQVKGEYPDYQTHSIKNTFYLNADQGFNPYSWRAPINWEGIVGGKKIKFTQIDSDYSGVIIEKLVDTLNHNIETLTIKKNSDTIEWMTNFDISGFFKYVEEFDSLLKKPNEIYVKIFRNNKLDTTFLLIMAAKKTIINKS